MLCLNFSLTFALGCEIFSGWIFPSQLSFTWEILEHIEYSALRQNMKIYISKQMWPNWHPNPMARINTHGGKSPKCEFSRKENILAFTFPSISRQTHFIVLTLPLHIPLLFGMFPFLIPFFFLLAFYFWLLPYLSISLPIIPSSLFLLPSLFLWIIHQCFSELLSACLLWFPLGLFQGPFPPRLGIRATATEGN